MPGPGVPSDATLRELVSAVRVRRRIDELAERMASDYASAPLTLVVIAEGARRFAEALVERLARSLHLEVAQLRVRRTRGTRLEGVRILDPELPSLEDRHVLIVDDIVDEGRTLEAVVGLIEKGGSGSARPRSVRVAVLVNKLARRAIALPLDYVGFEVEDGWVVGLGMDLDGRYRELDYIAVAEGAPQQDGRK